MLLRGWFTVVVSTIVAVVDDGNNVFVIVIVVVAAADSTVDLVFVLSSKAVVEMVLELVSVSVNYTLLDLIVEISFLAFPRELEMAIHNVVLMVIATEVHILMLKVETRIGPHPYFPDLVSP